VKHAAASIVLDGFFLDPVAKTPEKGVDVVVDGKAYGATNGSARQDVATYFKAPALVNVGFASTLPPGSVASGPHSLVVRVVAADGAGYFESPAIPFTMK
jgi:hypothetical protein